MIFSNVLLRMSRTTPKVIRLLTAAESQAPTAQIKMQTMLFVRVSPTAERSVRPSPISRSTAPPNSSGIYSANATLMAAHSREKTICRR